MLDIDQVNKLSPFMFDLKKEGAMETYVDTIRLGDSLMVMQHRNKQSFTFKVMVDEGNHPVLPDSTASTASRGGGGWNEGGITVWCFGGCFMVNTQLCLMQGCKAMENACGCLPPICGVCGDWGCDSVVSGFVSGGIVML